MHWTVSVHGKLINNSFAGKKKKTFAYRRRKAYGSVILLVSSSGLPGKDLIKTVMSSRLTFNNEPCTQRVYNRYL